MRDYVTGYHVYRDIWEASTGDSYYANESMVTVLIQLSKGLL